MSRYQVSMVGCWISILHRYGNEFIADHLKNLGISKGHHLYLVALGEREGIHQEDLVEYLNIDKATTTRALDKLEKSGFLIRKTNPSDRRSNELYLTEMGRGVLTDIHKVLRTWTNILTKEMSEAEKAFISQLFEKMFQNVMSYTKYGEDHD